MKTQMIRSFLAVYFLSTAFAWSETNFVDAPIRLDGIFLNTATKKELDPILFQNLSLCVAENMVAIRESCTGRTEYLRHYRCKQFPNLFNDECNIGVTQFWIAPVAVFCNQEHLKNLRGYRATSPGIIIGIDSQPNSRTITGVVAAYTNTNMHWKRTHSKVGKAHIQSAYFGCYGTYLNDCFYVNASVIGSYEWYKVRRHLHVFTHLHKDVDLRDRLPRERRDPRLVHFFKRTAKNRHKGYAVNSHLGTGLQLAFGILKVEPFANVDYDFVDQDGYRERGANALDLRVKANRAHLLRSEAGATMSYCIPYNCAKFRPSLSLSYVRKDILQGDKFYSEFIRKDEYLTSTGTKKALQFVSPSLGIEVLFSNNYIFSINYTAEINSQAWVQRGMISFERLY